MRNNKFHILKPTITEVQSLVSLKDTIDGGGIRAEALVRLEFFEDQIVTHFTGPHTAVLCWLSKLLVSA